jgi:hypothetical protein
MLDRFQGLRPSMRYRAPYFERARAEVSRYLFDCRRRHFVEPAEEKRSSATGRRMNTDDPIIAAIEAHRRACAETWAAYERRNAVEDELVAGVRVATGEAESDPQWLAADDAAGEALAVQDDLAVKLLETQPTTIAGAAALLTYYVDAVTTTQPEVVFPELDGNGRPFASKSIDEPRRDFAYFIVRNVAAALSNMAHEAIDPLSMPNLMPE